MKSYPASRVKRRRDSSVFVSKVGRICPTSVDEPALAVIASTILRIPFGLARVSRHQSHTASKDVNMDQRKIVGNPKKENISRSSPASSTRERWDLLKRMAWNGVKLTAIMLIAIASATRATPLQDAPAPVRKFVAQIEKADYEGDRAALQSLYAKLLPFTSDEKLASRVRYWRGFALWRRAINGFNESVDPKDLQHDLELAFAEFKQSSANDPGFVEAKIGAISCLSILVSFASGDSARMQDLIAQSSSLVKEVKAQDSDNPRFHWVMGPILWNIPAERGGGQDRAMEGYRKGLEAARKTKAPSGQTLDPAWGEPELLMSLAWSNLNKTAPDLKSAEASARAALTLIPYWHYVRDILLPQIQKAEAAT